METYLKEAHRMRSSAVEHRSDKPTVLGSNPNDT